MTTFFRKLRASLLAEGKTGRYLRYAIGEILLVVIGILIAVQINNWNETRKEQKKAVSFLVKMSEEIQSDVKYLMENDSLFAIYESDSEKAIEKFYQAKSIKDYRAVHSLFTTRFRNLRISRSTYDEMLNTGSFYTLKNKNLRDKIRAYYSYLQSQQYSIEQINIESSERYRNPDLFPFRFQLYPNSKEHYNFDQIDTSWIGNVNSPTFLALQDYYIVTQGAANTFRRIAYKNILDMSNELLEEIEDELGTEK